jgi:ABC-type Zn uptake system ZnuABC Zn-binding protein ZnuA
MPRRRIRPQRRDRGRVTAPSVRTPAGAWLGVAVACTVLAACSGGTASTPSGPTTSPARSLPAGSPGVATADAAATPLRVVATTTLVGDVVRAVGGDRIALTVLLPVGADAHTFEPTPRDIAAVADAEVVFANGLGLERFLEPLIADAGGDATVVSVSEGIQPLTFLDGSDTQPGDVAGVPDGARVDPHVWLDPTLVAVTWVDHVTQVLTARDPSGAGAYGPNAEAYRRRLVDLDNRIRAAMATVPAERRRIVTDHAVFGYFCRRYGCATVGTVFPGLSSLSEPSASGLAALEDQIRSLRVPAIFVGTTTNPDLATRVAADTGTHVVGLYTESLGPAAGPAGEYEGMMDYNVRAIVDALR